MPARDPQPSVPVQPESLDAARRRFPLAMQQLYDHGDPDVVGGEKRPGLQLQQVFDFEDGIRLIASRELLDRVQHIHVSASITPGPLFDFLKALPPALAMEEFKTSAEQRWRALSGSTRPMRFIGWTPHKGVPHWWIDLP